MMKNASLVPLLVVLFSIAVVGVPVVLADQKQQTHTDASSACGEPADAWHPTVVDGCNAGHEHGDAPPQWIADAGYQLSFHGDFNTSPQENTAKHPAMKGFLTALHDVDVYFRIHAASNPLDRSARFHSYEVFARDPSTNVSHWQGWYNSGDPDKDRLPRSGGDPPTRPAILVVDQAAWDAGIRCEQWYGFTAPWSWDFGWTICNATTLYQSGENASAADERTWVLAPDGTTGTTRRLEASFYGPNSHFAANRGAPPKDAPFWATQFGEIVSGPDDRRCTESTTLFGQTYANICLSEYIASTMPAVEFPGNSDQKQFDARGVHIPN